MFDIPAWWRAAWTGLFLAILPSLSHAGKPLPAASRVLFETGFEPFEGYRADADLAGQDQWVAVGNGGNGILREADGLNGQVAYLGYARGTNDFLNLYRPLAFSPATNRLPVVRFTVAFQIIDSTTNALRYDNFGWSAYNTLDERLFTLEFDNENQVVNFELDDGKGFKFSEVTFRAGDIYDLTIDLNFNRNQWTAYLGNKVVVDSKPITTQGAKLDLNAMDAVWAVRKTGSPGDNFMIFDDYKVVATPPLDLAPFVEPVGRPMQGKFAVRVYGEPGINYRVEGSTNLVTWKAIGSGRAPVPSGILELSDTNAPGLNAKFYRAYSAP